MENRKGVRLQRRMGMKKPKKVGVKRGMVKNRWMGMKSGMGLGVVSHGIGWTGTE